MSEYIINDENFRARAVPPRGRGRGYWKKAKAREGFRHRDHALQKQDVEIKIPPRELWPELCAEQKANKSNLADRWIGEVLDQGNRGYCWTHSGAHCIMALQRAANMPYRRLSAYAVACKIMNFRDRGGWGALGLEFMTEHGIPDVDAWPERSVDRSLDNPATWENAKRNRVVEGWVDLDYVHPADADMTDEQVCGLLAMCHPVIGDFNWWGHSVGLLALLDLKPQLKQQGLYDPNRWGKKLPNSWGPTWGENGWGVLTGQKAITDGASTPRAIVVT